MEGILNCIKIAKKLGVLRVIPLSPVGKCFDFKRTLYEFHFADATRYFSAETGFMPIDGRWAMKGKLARRYKFKVVVEDFKKRDITFDDFMLYFDKTFIRENNHLSHINTDVINEIMAESPPIKTCKNCGKEIIPDRPNKIFCGRKCRAYWHKYSKNE